MNARTVDGRRALRLATAVLLFCAGNLLGQLTGVVQAHASAAPWRISPSADLNGTLPLTDVSCGSPAFCVAIGSTDIETWNGKAWSSPEVLGTASLASVSCASKTFCVAVGLAYLGPGLAVIETWNGSRWTVTANPGRYGQALVSVSCPTEKFCMAVGYNLNEVNQPSGVFAWKWDGTSWSIAKNLPSPEGALLRSVSCPTADFCLATGYRELADTDAYTLAETWTADDTRWYVVPSVSPGDGDALGTVSCTSPKSCWAVGTASASHGVYLPLMEHWQGRELSAVKGLQEPLPGLGIDGISCTASASCKIVGAYVAPGGYTVSGELRYMRLAGSVNGGSVSLSTAATTGSSALYAIDCLGQRFCAAVGTGPDTVGSAAPQTGEWNGRSWTFQASPQVGLSANVLSGTSCASAVTCMSVGTTGPSAELSDDDNWIYIGAVGGPDGGTDTDNALTSVSCPAPDDCLAVGSFHDATTGESQTLTDSWTGSDIFDNVASPDEGASASESNVLAGVSCVSTTDCIAVGYYELPRETQTFAQTLVEQWNGTSWAIVPSPDLPDTDNGLYAVDCISASDCVAVGSYGVTSQPLVEQWNGSTWTITTSQTVGAGDASELTGVTCPSATHCVAVGDYYDSAGVDQTMAESWNGMSWSLSPSLNDGSGNNQLSDIACIGSTDCMAVGSFTDASGVQQTLLESWDGSSWSIVPSPDQASANALTSVAAAGKAGFLAVGTWTDDGAQQTLAVTNLPPAATATYLPAVTKKPVADRPISVTVTIASAHQPAYSASPGGAAAVTVGPRTCHAVLYESAAGVSQGTCSVAGLPTGSYAVQASYAGDSDFGPSTAKPRTITVSK